MSKVNPNPNRKRGAIITKQENDVPVASAPGSV